jgi:hypothetical protein
MGSRAQRMAALEQGNDVRRRRAALKREIRQGQIGEAAVAALMQQRRYPSWLEPMKVREVLAAVPKLGDKRVDALMEQGKCTVATTLGGMSRTQRTELSEAILRRHDRVRRRRTSDAIREAQRGW